MKKIILIIYLIIAFSSCTHPERSSPLLETNNIPSYNRGKWKHWIDSDKNCLNTRHEILKQRSKVAVKFNSKGCSVVSGSWDDYYYPEQHFSSKKIDIDHLVPLKHAHDHGGYKWSSDQKTEFANDFDNLVITNRTYNRQKGSLGVDSWLPIHKSYACKYLQDWVKIKKKYNLEFSEKELLSIKTTTESVCN